MSPMSRNVELELDLEESAEVISQQHAIHEYAFGIISSDSKGRSSVVSISEPYKKSFPTPGSSPGEEDLHSWDFHSWSMSSYQSSGFHEEEEEEAVDEDDFKDDPNNNMASMGSLPRVESRLSLRGGSSGGHRLSSNPRKISAPTMRRRWSTSNIFGGKTPPQVRVFPVDPDMPSSVSPPENWFSSITQIPDKIRQHMADRNRFDVSSVSRDQLKQLHCY